MEKDAEITRLRAELAAVTAERDRMREALKPFIVVLFNAEVEDLSTGQIYGWGFEKEHLRRARAALEGVTEPPRLKE